MWYNLDIQPDGETWMVTCPDFEEVVSFGETIPQACAHGRDAIEEAIAARMAHGEDLPSPPREKTAQYTVEMPMLVQLKSALYMILRTSGLTRADLQRLMKLKHREQVDRLLRLDHRTQIDTLLDAFRVLGQPVKIDIPMPPQAA